MNTIVAETPEQVRDWVEHTPHHQGRWLNKDREDVNHPDESAYLELSNHTDALLIPVELHSRCFFNVSTDAERMFGWDYGAEEAAKSTRDV